MLNDIFSRSRRRFLRNTALGSLWLTLRPLFAAKDGTESNKISDIVFLWSGGITSSSAVVNAKLTEDTTVRLAVSNDGSFSNPVFSDPADANENDNNRVVRLEIDGLSADTQYFYAIEENGTLLTSKTGRFRTFPAGNASFSFAFASCADTGSNRKVFESIENLNPSFFMHVGDMHYENIESADRDLFRDALDTVLDSSRQSSLYRNIPLVYMWDDHDYGPNNSHRESPGREAAQRTYREYVPHYPLVEGSGDKPIYQAFDVGRTRFIMTDLRSERVPSSEPDNSQKTMMGDVQKDWLKQQLLLSSNYALVFWVNTVPWIHVEAEGKDHWGGYTTEREELATFIRQNGINNLVMLSGDAHMLAVDDGSNNTYGGGVGFPVLHAACLDRPPSQKGGPYSEGAYPGAGQFGLVTVTDTGTDISLSYSGQDEDGNEILSYEWNSAVLGTDSPDRVPNTIKLEQNYPNPFNGNSTIRFYLDKTGRARLEVFDLRGRKVSTLIDQERPAGWHESRVSSDTFPSGTYFYRLTTSRGSIVRKLTLLK